MGYILHLIDTLDVHNAQSAEQFILAQQALKPSANLKIQSFVRDITSVYPDLSEEDEDGDNDENLWEEGIDANASFGNVKELVLKVDLTDQTVLTALIQTANRNGLKLYDSEGQIVY